MAIVHFMTAGLKPRGCKQNVAHTSSICPSENSQAYCRRRLHGVMLRELIEILSMRAILHGVFDKEVGIFVVKLIGHGGGGGEKWDEGREESTLFDLNFGRVRIM
jgi:hypothetical protein